MGCSTPKGLETRVYLVDDLFWKSITPIVEPDTGYSPSDEEDSRSLTDFMSRTGVEFPKGAFISVHRKTSQVTMRNTSTNLDRLEHLMGPMCGEGVFYKERLK